MHGNQQRPRSSNHFRRPSCRVLGCSEKLRSRCACCHGGISLQRSQGLLGCVNGVPWSLQEHACRWKRRASQKPHLLQKAFRRPAPAAMPPCPRQLLCLAEGMSHGPSGWSCHSSLKQQPPVRTEGLLLCPQCFNIVHVHQGALEANISCLAFDECTTDAERGRIALYPS